MAVIPVKPIIGLACPVVQFLVLLFVVIAIPVDVLRGPNTPWRVCYSMWGIKRCGSHAVNPGRVPHHGFPCSGLMHTMNAAATFAIFSVVLALVGLILFALSFFRLVRIPKMLSIIVCVAAFLTIAISWACIAGSRIQSCRGAPLLAAYDLYGGFGLLVTAWVLELGVCILTFFA